MAPDRVVPHPAAVPVTTNLVVQYSVLHGVVFAMIGVLIAYLIVSSQREPRSSRSSHAERQEIIACFECCDGAYARTANWAIIRNRSSDV